MLHNNIWIFQLQGSREGIGIVYVYNKKKEEEEPARETHWVLVCVLSFHFCKSDYIAREENAGVMRKTAHTHGVDVRLYTKQYTHKDSRRSIDSKEKTRMIEEGQKKLKKKSLRLSYVMYTLYDTKFALQKCDRFSSFLIYVYCTERREQMKNKNNKRSNYYKSFFLGKKKDQWYQNQTIVDPHPKCSCSVAPNLVGQFILRRC